MKFLKALPLLLCAEVYALDIDVDPYVGIGYSCAEEPPNGRWYQKEFPYSLDMCSPTYDIGLDWSTPWENWSVLTGYINLVHVETSALASSSDLNYAKFKAGEEDIWPLSTWEGRGGASGIYITPKYTYNGFFVKAGVWMYKAPWSVHIPDWRAQGPQGPMEPRELNVSAEDDAQVGFTWGVGYERKHLSVSYEVHIIEGPAKFRPGHVGKVQSLLFKYTF